MKQRAIFAKKTIGGDNYLDLIKLVFPEFLVEHFDLVKSRKDKEVLHLYFEERNTPLVEHASRILISKGFHKEVTIQDFPFRGNKMLNDGDGWIKTLMKLSKGTGN